MTWATNHHIYVYTLFQSGDGYGDDNDDCKVDYDGRNDV